MATNKVSRSEEAFVDTRVYSEAVEEEVRLFVLRLLKRLSSEIPEKLLAKIQLLLLEHLEALALDLLDFSSMADLEGWLQGQPRGEISCKGAKNNVRVWSIQMQTAVNTISNY
ncbi:hypothetical protein A6769_34005 [Nostoc punctiforme NIES-2108]|uniref:DUF4351 domain-containing protein n=1 Tax=Nostoc punctiforme NIES-2108 TaxID=1356359 RepID=A0A367R4A5_NOSPU|nr:hypothetical protein A6769_34005 [Nostoc punctiforme NIES-2108]